MNFVEDEDYEFNHEELDNMDFPLSESEDSDVEQKSEKISLGMKERVNMIDTRSKINNLRESVAEKREKYQRIKEELAICDNHMLELKKEENMTLSAIESNQRIGNVAAIFRLQGQLKRVVIEQEGEQDVYLTIRQRLVEAEQELINSELEEGKYTNEELKLKEMEETYEHIQENIQKKRLYNETKLTKNAQRSLKYRKSEAERLAEDQENQRKELEQSLAEAHSIHGKYLQKTTKEQRERKAKLEKTKIDEQKKKEQSLQKLKSDILQTKENMTSINAKRKADELQQLEIEKKLQSSALEKGANPKLELKKYKNQIKTLETKEKFVSNIKEGQVKIAEKISGEVKNIMQKKQLMPYLFDNGQKEAKVKMTTKAELLPTDKGIIDDNQESMLERWQTWDIRSSAGLSSITHSKDKEIPETLSFITDELTSTSNKQIHRIRQVDNEEVLNVPEFQGMWNTTVEYKVPKDALNLPIKDEKASKMEQEIMQRVLKQLKENIVQPQVVGGKLFKGKSFQSKPEVILFENLEVGQKYTQRVILTNTSYGTNQCRYERITEQLMDFISIRFSPPGPLSPGMTFDFTVTFEPKLPQDLYGEVFFTSQSERFSIPLVCLTKKCKMTVDKQLIKFNTSVIGETIIQGVILKNSGAKGTFVTLKNKDKNDENENKDSDNNDIDADNSNEYECITTSLGNNKLWIEPYSEQEIIIKWSPTLSGDYQEEFFISFEDEDNEGFDLRVVAKAIDVPVYIADPIISMDICMVDRLYQDTIIFHSRAATALKMQFKVPTEIRDYLEILPNMGFIQAGQEFKAQLKLIVKSSIFTENCPFFDVDTGILDVPISASIANQVKTVDFSVQAVVTVTDLEIVSIGCDPSLIDFGHCTINEIKVKSLRLINKSILPQEFGFTGYPEYVEIQPNHGYGIILPKEELTFQVMFSPKKADNFQFLLRCQTIIDRSFSLPCRGIGVHPSLELSKQIITFPYTAVNDMSSVDLFLFNKHVSTNIYTHEPPRIGTESVIPVGPKTYQMLLPDNTDASIHPRAGTINPGESQKLTIFFNPKLSDESIKSEAAETVNNDLEREAKQKWEVEVKDLEKQRALETVPAEPQLTEVESKGKKSSKKQTRPGSDKRKSTDLLEELVKAGPAKIVKVESNQIAIDSEEYLKGKLSLLQKFDFNFEIIKAKCIIADGSMSDDKKLVYNSKNVLELELHCPCVKPDLVILYNGGRPLIDFGEHILNERVLRTISVQNISSDVIKLKSSALDPNGSYQICNALRELEPNGVANIAIAFTASSEGVFETNWSISGKKRSKMLKLKFRATGISPNLEIKELKDGIINVGTVIVNEFVEKPLTLVNNSMVDIQYKIELSYKDDCNQPFGVNNMSGLSVFTLTPQLGVISAGKSQNVTLTFASDHESDRFLATGKLILFDKVESLQFRIKGESKSNILYLKNADDCLDRPLEYLGDCWAGNSLEHEDISSVSVPARSMVLILQSTLSDDGSVVEGRGSFIIGCVRTMAVSQKKNGEFTIDNINVLTPLGFSVDTVKGQIEADSEKSITVSWIPTPQYEIGTIVSTIVNITLKGDTSLSYVIELKASVR